MRRKGVNPRLCGSVVCGGLLVNGIVDAWHPAAIVFDFQSSVTGAARHNAPVWTRAEAKERGLATGSLT